MKQSEIEEKIIDSISDWDIIKSILNREEGAGFIFNPTEVMVPLQDDAYDILIDYFAEEEEYEKCSELKQSKHFLKSLFI